MLFFVTIQVKLQPLPSVYASGKVLFIDSLYNRICLRDCDSNDEVKILIEDVPASNGLIQVVDTVIN